MATAIYLRVSTAAQNLRGQEMDLKEWAKGKEAVLWFRDKSSGSNFDRPAFQKLEEAISAGKIDTLVVWRLDRLGRTVWETVRFLDTLEAAKIKFVSLKDGFDSSTPAGRLMRNLLTSFAAYETEVRRERQTAGMAAAKAKGIKWGGKKVGSVSRKIAAKIPAVKAMLRENKSISDISRALEVPRKTIYVLIERHNLKEPENLKPIGADEIFNQLTGGSSNEGSRQMLIEEVPS